MFALATSLNIFEVMRPWRSLRTIVVRGTSTVALDRLWNPVAFQLLEQFWFHIDADVHGVTNSYIKILGNRSLKNVQLPTGALAVLDSDGLDCVRRALLTAEKAVIPCLPHIDAPLLVELELDFTASPPSGNEYRLQNVRHLTLTSSDRRGAGCYRFNTPELATLKLVSPDNEAGFQLVGVNTPYLRNAQPSPSSTLAVAVEAPKLSQLRVDSAVETLCVHAPWLEQLKIESRPNLTCLFLNTPYLRDLGIRWAEQLTTLIIASSCLEQCLVYGTPNLASCVLSSPILKRARFKTAHVHTLRAESATLRELVMEGATNLTAIQLHSAELRSFRCPESPNVHSVVVESGQLDVATVRQLKFLELLAKDRQAQGGGPDGAPRPDPEATVLRHFESHHPESVAEIATFLASIPRTVVMCS